MSVPIFSSFQGAASAETSKQDNVKPDNAELKVVESSPFPALSVCFQREEGWTGADGAYSIAVDGDRTLWFFGDTWIGPIRDGKRVTSKNRMVHNTLASQMLRDAKVPAATAIDLLGKNPFNFYWKSVNITPCSRSSLGPGVKSQKPDDVFIPEEKDCYYWPGDGATIDGSLYLFMHLIKNKPDNPEPFQFERIGDDLLKIENPLDEAANWRWQRVAVSRTVNGPNFGIACLSDSKYLYSYCSYPAAKSGLNAHPLIVARIERSSLPGLFQQKSKELSESSWEFWCDTEEWNKKFRNPKILFQDAAPEMSVTRVPGVDGYVAAYMPPFDQSIYLRHSKNPQGPFGPRVVAYKCPESEKWMLLYSAKAHPELTNGKGDMIITYCRNTADFSFHQKVPSIYAPQGVRVVIARQASGSSK